MRGLVIETIECSWTWKGRFGTRTPGFSVILAQQLDLSQSASQHGVDRPDKLRLDEWNAF